MFKEFLNVANEEKFTILGGKLFQTFTTRSLKSFPACSCGSSKSHLRGGSVAPADFLDGEVSDRPYGSASIHGHLPSRRTLRLA